MKFLKVSAVRCDAKGLPTQGSMRTEMRLNTDLIEAISGTSIQLKGGNMYQFGDSLYKDFKVGNGVDLNKI